MSMAGKSREKLVPSAMSPRSLVWCDETIYLPTSGTRSTDKNNLDASASGILFVDYLPSRRCEPSN